MNEQLNKLYELLKKLNGANIIIENEKEEILVFKAKYGRKLIMLPGGNLERNELPHHAVQSESEEETGKYPLAKALRLVGIYMQRVPGLANARGFNFLYVCTETQGELMESDESNMPIFLSVKKIFARRAEFGTSYLKMIVHYLKWKKDGIVDVKRLSDPVSILIDGKLIEV